MLVSVLRGRGWQGERGIFLWMQRVCPTGAWMAKSRVGTFKYFHSLSYGGVDGKVPLNFRARIQMSVPRVHGSKEKLKLLTCGRFEL